MPASAGMTNIGIEFAMKNKVDIANIIIIDDDKGMCKTLSRILELDGYKVSTANTASEGIEFIKKGHFNLAVVDIKLPDMDGVDLLELLRKIDQELSVIMMTAYASTENAIKALNIGADAFVTKPFDIEELRVVVKKSIEKQRLSNEKKRLEKELKESLEKYMELFESINDALAVFMIPDGKLGIYNTRFAGLFGYSEQELKGKRLLDFVYTEDLPKAQERFDKKIAGEEVEDIYEIRMLNRNGEVFFLEIGDRPYSQKGKTVGIEVIMRDISERRKIEEQLIQSEKLRAVGQMASGVAHDFNNALAIILGITELLERQVNSLNPEEIKRQLKVIETAALDAAETVRRIQEFTRIRIDKEYSKVNINEIVEEVKEMSKPRWKDQAQEKGINIELTTLLEKDLPPVMGNPSELREVLTNVIFNSIDAMPEGGKIVIETRNINKEIQIQVTDTGEGIPQEVRRRIFDPFFTTKGVISDGLGLSIAYNIITRQGGRIEIESEERKGTAVKIILPVPSELKEDKEEGTLREDVGSTNILVIDDEEMVRNILGNLLKQGGHNVFSASSGKEGLALFNKGGIDLVFTDLGMPGISGWEVAKSIKAIDSSVPVALITGWGFQIDDEKMKESGADLVLNKPFKIDEVLDLVAEAMEIKRKLSSI
jgi:PAS domain S-box-containing protein